MLLGKRRFWSLRPKVRKTLETGTTSKNQQINSKVIIIAPAGFEPAIPVSGRRILSPVCIPLPPRSENFNPEKLVYLFPDREDPF